MGRFREGGLKMVVYAGKFLEVRMREGGFEREVSRGRLKKGSLKSLS